MYVSVRSDVAYFPLGIHVEIESLRLDFHILPTWMIDVEAPGNRVFETRFLIGLFQIFRLYSLTHTHTHTHTLTQTRALSLSQPHLHFPTYIFISHTKFLLTKLSHFLSISHMASHIRTRAHTHNHVTSKSRAQPSPATTLTRLSPAIDSSPPRSLSPSLEDPLSFSPSLSLPPPYPF